MADYWLADLPYNRGTRRTSAAFIMCGLLLYFSINQSINHDF